MAGHVTVVADCIKEHGLFAIAEFLVARLVVHVDHVIPVCKKAFSRQGMKLSKYRQRFPTDFDPKLERSNYLETKRADFEKDAAEEVKRIVLENRADLTDVERTVIEHRFGLETTDGEKPMTLEQVGQKEGITKERVRQIEARGLSKLKTLVEEGVGEM